MKTYGDWFTGFGGMTLGAIAVGLEVVFGAELEPAIADVYRQNIGDHIMVCDLLQTPVTAFPHVDVFHASPPCPNFSNAKTNAEETERDIALSEKVAEYIAYHLPDIFTLENVYQYRNSKSWQTIAQTLHTHGYLFNYWHVNMADYGVPQTRQRMIVIARRDGVMPRLPEATHTAEPLPSLFGTMPRWVSWYEAIEDLIPLLPDSKFAPWQLERLPEELKTGMVMTGNSNFRDASPGKGYLVDEPANTVTAQLTGGMPRAFIVNTREMHLSDSGASYTARGNDEPIYTLSATSGASRNKAFTGDRVVQMTPRCLARFQSFSDWYKLPPKSKDAVYGIGNAVPPLFAEKLFCHLTAKTVVMQ